MYTPLNNEQNNNALSKISPEKILSDEQITLQNKVEEFCKKHIVQGQAVFIIEGNAGTGKSLVLNKIFNTLQKQARDKNGASVLQGTQNYLVVNHPEMMKLYKNSAGKFPYLKQKDFERPTTFINRMHKEGKKADILLIDEAHLLLTRPDNYNRFTQENQLEELLKLARVVVLVFDEKQTLKFKSYWNKSLLNTIAAKYSVQTYHLKQQFRMHAGADIQCWIEEFCQKKILPIPQKQLFDFQFFDDAQNLYETLKEKNALYGLSRLVATYDYPYTLDGQDHFITEGRFHLRWDRSKPQEKLPWAERPDTIDEVGSVYTVQGFDLNYVGVILGPSVLYNASTDGLRLDPTRYEDSAAFAGRGGLLEPEQVKERIMLNALNVLLTRAVRGLYIYAHDPALRARLMALQAKAVLT